MSFREIRNFTEIMRNLDYPRLISMQNFRSPNFRLVAEILTWLVKRFDPLSQMPIIIDTESDRIVFIQCIAKFFMVNAGISVNTKKLYEANGNAVRELLKLATYLHSAMEVTCTTMLEDDNIYSLPRIQNQSISKNKELRNLASGVVNSGASLHSSLQNESNRKSHRVMALNKDLTLDKVEEFVTECLKNVEKQISESKSMTDLVVKKSAELDGNIMKAKSDLSKHKERLQTLRNCRPRYMDEYEQVELELKSVYEEYVAHYCNLMYLNNLLEEDHKNELSLLKVNMTSQEEDFSDDDEEEWDSVFGTDMELKEIYLKTAVDLNESTISCNVTSDIFRDTSLDESFLTKDTFMTSSIKSQSEGSSDMFNLSNDQSEVVSDGSITPPSTNSDDDFE